MYSLIRPLLFRLDPERVHAAAMVALEVAQRLGLDRRPLERPTSVMGLEFTNPVGLAAGFDKNARHVDALMALGFGFIEIGTLTPRPQPGNARPRLFRLPQAQALINRMGFNNDGVEAALARLSRTRYNGILGISIGKNTSTSLDTAVDDYLLCLRQVYPYASYVAINVSSPGTVGLRRLQEPGYLARLLGALKSEQAKIADSYGKYVPLVVKLAPDFEKAELHKTCETLLSHAVDGIIATNTTLSRDGVQGLRHAEEAGGLSGAPLREKATEVLQALRDYTEGRIPLIASGGIMTADDALARLAAGASLVQLYTGFVYRGPRLINEIVARIPE